MKASGIKYTTNGTNFVEIRGTLKELKEKFDERLFDAHLLDNTFMFKSTQTYTQLVKKLNKAEQILNGSNPAHYEILYE